jgi:hypothetical protein
MKTFFYGDWLCFMITFSSFFMCSPGNGGKPNYYTMNSEFIEEKTFEKEDFRLQIVGNEF